MRKLLLGLLCVLPALAAHAAEGASPDLAALIQCKGHIGDFNALQPALEDPLKAVALGWKPLPQTNMFMTEFELVYPLTVFGQTTRHIAFAGPSVLAVLDLPDPHPLAKQLQLETGFDTAEKAMFGREVSALPVTDPKTGKPMIESIILSVSNVKTLPGKTLAGCSYSLDEPAEPAPDAAAPAPAGKAG